MANPLNGMKYEKGLFKTVNEIEWLTMDSPIFLNSKGEVRKAYRKMRIELSNSIIEHLNRINLSLYNTVSGKGSIVDDNW